MNRVRWRIRDGVRSLLVVMATSSVALAVRAQSPLYGKRHVTFKNGDLTLAGYLYMPAGSGPFPAILWNHGSEPDPGGGPQFDSVAAIFVPAGFAVFAPMRRGHSDSQGEYIRQSTQNEIAAHGNAAGMRLAARLLETSQLEDQLAGLTFLKQQRAIDTTRVVVAGCSYGGIQTLFGAMRKVGYRAAVSISPAALSWNNSPDLQERLKNAVSRIDVPVFLIQPPKDASLEPSRVLGAILRRRNAANRVKVFPTSISADLQEHCFGGAKGMGVWGPDAVDFIRAALK